MAPKTEEIPNRVNLCTWLHCWGNSYSQSVWKEHLLYLLQIRRQEHLYTDNIWRIATCPSNCSLESCDHLTDLFHIMHIWIWPKDQWMTSFPVSFLHFTETRIICWQQRGDGSPTRRACWLVLMTIYHAPGLSLSSSSQFKSILYTQCCAMISTVQTSCDPKSRIQCGDRINKVNGVVNELAWIMECLRL